MLWRGLAIFKTSQSFDQITTLTYVHMDNFILNFSSSAAEGEYEFLEDSDGYLKPNGRFEMKKPQSSERTTSNDEYLIKRMQEKISALEAKKVKASIYHFLLCALNVTLILGKRLTKKSRILSKLFNTPSFAFLQLREME
jgi:hypothetical protein